MTTFQKIVSASRPKTLPASIGPVLLGLSLSYNATNEINLVVALTTLLCAILLQVSSNLINDYYDGIRGIDGAQRLGPKRIASTDKMLLKTAWLITLILSFVLGIFLMFIGGKTIIVIGLSSILFAYLYTGGPLPLSYYYLGEILALVFFGPVAVYGTYFLQTNQFSLTPIVIGLGPGLIASGIMSINNLRDLESDSKTSKRTLAIALGEKGARLLTLTLILLSSFIPYIGVDIFNLSNSTIFTTIIFYLFFYNWLAIYREKISEKFNNYLATTGKYLFVYSLVYSICIVL